MCCERRLPPALPLLRLVGQLSVAAFVPLVARGQALPCGTMVINSGNIQATYRIQENIYYGNSYHFFSCSWQLLSNSSDPNVSLQLSGLTLDSWSDSVSIYDERNISETYNGYDSYIHLWREVILGKSGRVTFSTYRNNNSSRFSAYLESIDLSSSSRCQRSAGYWWCEFLQMCFKIDRLCDRRSHCEVVEDRDACSSTTTRRSTTRTTTPVQAPSCEEVVIGARYIQSPRYPDNYNDFMGCSWQLLSQFNSGSVSLQVSGFKLGSWTDSFTIYDERSIGMSYSGFDTLPAKVFLGKSGMLTFRRISSSASSGFSAYVESVNLTSTSQCQTNDGYWCTSNMRCISKYWLCDKRQDCALGEDENACFLTMASSLTTRMTTSIQPTASQCGGLLTNSTHIQSPNYPEKYPNNVICTWKIFSKSNKSLWTLKFYTFDLETKWDYITVYDDRGIASNYTGRSLPPTATLGTSGWLTFFSDSSVSFTGFRAYLESTDMMNQSQCTTSDVFWCAFSGKCISTNWHCDGQPDCANEEDESHCPSSTHDPATTVAIWLPIAFGVVILIISISLVIVYRRRCKLKHQTDIHGCPHESRNPAYNPGNIYTLGSTASPSEPAQRVLSSDPPLYSDLFNSCQPVRPETEEPPAYYTVCEHGLAICTQAELVATSSTLEPPLYSHLV